MKRFDSFPNHIKTLELIMDNISNDKTLEAMTFMQNVYEALPSYKTLLGASYYNTKMNEKWGLVYESVRREFKDYIIKKD